MKRLGLALATFLIWGSIASTYYVCVVRGLCASETPKPKIVNSPEHTFVTPANSKSPEDFIKKKAVPLKKDTTLTKKEITRKVAEIDSLIEKGLVISYNDKLVKSFPLNFRIYKKSGVVRIPLGLREYGNVLKDVMLKNNAELTINGYYHKDLEDSIVGYERARKIQKLLFSASFPKKHVFIKSKKAKFTYDNYVFRGGIDFEFTPSDTIIVFNRKKRRTY